MNTTRAPYTLALLLFLLTAGLVACGDDSPIETPMAEVSLLLTDMPGDVESLWIDVSRIYLRGFQGEGDDGNGETDLVTGSTGYIDVATLDGTTASLAEGVMIPAGGYTQLLFVVDQAVLETENGGVYATAGASLPAEVSGPVTGVLQCPSCTVDGIKILAPGGGIQIVEGAATLLLDFDLLQSVGRSAGRSGQWVMDPLIRVTDPQDAGTVSGLVQLDSGVTLPTCPSGGDVRTVEDFIPVATAVSLTDDLGDPVVVTGETDANGQAFIRNLDPDGYDLGFEPSVDLSGATLELTADVQPGQVDVGNGQTVTGVLWTITSATCNES